jgi:hypothetical protein
LSEQEFALTTSSSLVDMAVVMFDSRPLKQAGAQFGQDLELFRAAVGAGPDPVAEAVGCRDNCAPTSLDDPTFVC